MRCCVARRSVAEAAPNNPHTLLPPPPELLLPPPPPLTTSPSWSRSELSSDDCRGCGLVGEDSAAAVAKEAEYFRANRPAATSDSTSTLAWRWRALRWDPPLLEANRGAMATMRWDRFGGVQ